MHSEHTSELDLSKGKLFWKIPRFALPLMCTTIFQLLYTSVDLWTVSKFGGGSLSMTSIGSNNALINLLITFLVSLATGANVCMSIAKGERSNRAENILHTAFIVAFVGGIIFGIMGFFMAPIILGWMDTPASIMANATTYLKIYFIGLPLSVVYNFGVQMLRALGDSKRPFFISIIAGIINVILDIILVLNGLDVAGVAIATIISQAISAILVILWFQFNKRGYVKFDWKKLKISKRELLDILKIGIPAGLQGIAFCLPNLLIQSSLYKIQPYTSNGIYISQNEIIAGASASATIEGYIFAMLDTFAVALISFASTNYGARKAKNIRKSYWYSIAWTTIFWGFSTIICFTCYPALLQIFIKDSTAEGIAIIKEAAIEAGKQRLLLLSATYVLDGYMDVSGCYLKGMKNTLVPAIVTICACTGFRILFIYTIFTLEQFQTVFWLYIVMPISWTLAILTYIPFIIKQEKKVFKNIKESIELNAQLA